MDEELSESLLDLTMRLKDPDRVIIGRAVAAITHASRDADYWKAQANEQLDRAMAAEAELEATEAKLIALRMEHDAAIKKGVIKVKHSAKSSYHTGFADGLRKGLASAEQNNNEA
jgi:flagellar biosynthesis/type III secretory pathway protein FliH